MHTKDVDAASYKDMDTSYGSSYDVISINIAQTDWCMSDLRDGAS